MSRRRGQRTCRLWTSGLLPHLSRLHIKCEALSLSNGVADYLRKFSDKLFASQRFTRSDDGEQPGTLAVPGVTHNAVHAFVNEAVRMCDIGSYSRIPDDIDR